MDVSTILLFALRKKSAHYFFLKDLKKQKNNLVTLHLNHSYKLLSFLLNKFFVAARKHNTERNKTGFIARLRLTSPKQSSKK